MTAALYKTKPSSGRLISVTIPLKTAVDRFKPSAGPAGAAQVQTRAGLAARPEIPSAKINIKMDRLMTTR
jgi:hypothetical protein